MYPIGVFDSGFGGLEILREITKKIPTCDYLYLGDTARAPYGTRSQKVIYDFTQQAVNYLFEQGCPLVILACNTASSEALRKLQQEYLPKNYPRRRVLGVLIPAAQEAAKKTKNYRVGVLATEGTVSSKAFVKELKKINPKVKVFQQAASLLVPIVESGEHESKMADLALRKYLKPLLRSGIDTLILGCTHYGILADRVKKIAGSEINLIVEGKIVARKLENYLSRHPEIRRKISRGGQIRFLTTDQGQKFEALAGLFFGQPVTPTRVIL